MKPLLMGLLLLCCTGILKAQSPSVHGKVADTLEKKALPHAVVALIRKSDSSLVRFSRTDRNGSFRMNGIEPGNYQILVTYPKFADYTDDIQVKADGETALGTLPLTLKSKLLQEVVVRTGSAIRIKGDTTEYAADSFVVREGATVEDLLKKLPGFQVNSKGEIVAQGQRVSKVLVDGEEFFGDDPTMATQNLSAKAVDKVQVFDTKSEQQNLTGMTTGNEGKTVNIKLKEDKKKGAFGRGELGYNGGSLLNSKALYNNFIGKRKISVYGTKSSTSTGSLNWEERRQMGIENDMEYDEISGYYFSFGNDDGFNDWSLRGLPNSYTAGGLYINRWDADKKALNSSYRYNRLGTENV
ncbi:MAG TPA: carboxypeptidase-like regulatory domain-containing protein, partial [Chitinophagaceae bacterium]|nr:carboxypeptidase-like regulatory domain-containing protein [Chitinophagaceae bacterium]